MMKNKAGLNRQDDYYVMDITKVSSYSEFIDFVRRGYNRDKETLPQINLLMLTGVKSHMPLYYRIIPGSIKDVNTLQDSLANISFMKRIRMHSAAAMEGRVFIQFISPLITTRLKQVMNEAGWFKDYDLQEVLNEMKTVRIVSIQGRHKSTPQN